MESEVIFFFKQSIKWFKPTLRVYTENTQNQSSTSGSSKSFHILLSNAALEAGDLESSLC